MQAGGLSAFANAREEIQFWPAVTLAYYFTINSAYWVFLTLLVLIMNGAITYNLHQTYRNSIDKGQQIAERRSRNSRRNSTDDESVLDAANNLWESKRPEAPAKRKMVAFGMIFNFFAGVSLFFWLFWRLVWTNSATVVGMGLISLPLFSVAIMVSSLIWSS